MYLYTVTGAVGEEGYLDLAKSGDLTGKNDCVIVNDNAASVSVKSLTLTTHRLV